MRRFLLWCATNQWLRTNVPRLPGIRRAVRRFMPGETMPEALAAATALEDAGISSLFTRLGENLTEMTQADAVAAHYHALIDEIAARRLDGEVSPKLSQLGLDLDLEATYRHCASLAHHAATTGSRLWIDMEDSSYVDRTLDLYERLVADQPGVGVCLQAYLRRTPADVERLRPHGPVIRLVKGAYDEPLERAFRTRDEVDAAYRQLALSLLAEAVAGNLTLGLGTHDVELIEDIAKAGAAAGHGVDAFEVQMLYGIRVDQQHRLRAAGYRVRTLIAYGEWWYPWYVRRLAERPANLLFALRQLLPW